MSSSKFLWNHGITITLVIYIDSSPWLLCSPSVSNINTEQPATFALLTLHNISNKNNTCPVRCIPSFEFFHKPYQVLELIPCTEYLSPESQKSHFWKLKIGHHNCAGIKYICSKCYLQILEEFHQKLNELQQLEDELENNVQKWHWAGHVQKTIIWAPIN